MFSSQKTTKLGTQDSFLIKLKIFNKNNITKANVFRDNMSPSSCNITKLIKNESCVPSFVVFCEDFTLKVLLFGSLLYYVLKCKPPSAAPVNHLLRS